MLSFKPTFSLSTFTFIKRLLSSSSLSAIREVSSAYLRLLIFLPAILIPTYASSSPAFLMMYSAYLTYFHLNHLSPQIIFRSPLKTSGDIQSLGSQRSSAEGNGNPLQYSNLENSIYTVHGVAESDTTEPLSTHIQLIYVAVLKNFIYKIRQQAGFGL